MDPSQKSRGCQVDNSQFSPASHLTGASARSSLCSGQTLEVKERVFLMLM